jgi:hypothetical protein
MCLGPRGRGITPFFFCTKNSAAQGKWFLSHRWHLMPKVGTDYRGLVADPEQLTTNQDAGGV